MLQYTYQFLEILATATKAISNSIEQPEENRKLSSCNNQSSVVYLYNNSLTRPIISSLVLVWWLPNHYFIKGPGIFGCIVVFCEL